MKNSVSTPVNVLVNVTVTEDKKLNRSYGSKVENTFNYAIVNGRYLELYNSFGDFIGKKIHTGVKHFYGYTYHSEISFTQFELETSVRKDAYLIAQAEKEVAEKKEFDAEFQKALAKVAEKKDFILAYYEKNKHKFRGCSIDSTQSARELAFRLSVKFNVKTCVLKHAIKDFFKNNN